MTQAEIGAYILLLCNQWNCGRIPEDKIRLVLIAKGEVTEHVLSKFPSGKNKRLERERKKQRDYREKQRINGAMGGRPAKPNPNPSVSSGLSKSEPKKSSPVSVSSLQSPIEEREQRAHFPEAQIPSWEEFWGYCQSHGCLLPAEWYARDKWEAANADGWRNRSVWRAYARRCKAWWESDGRPMARPQKDSNGKPKGKSLLTKEIEKLLAEPT